jgi:hypothetical protein
MIVYNASNNDKMMKDMRSYLVRRVGESATNACTEAESINSIADRISFTSPRNALSNFGRVAYDGS